MEAFFKPKTDGGAKKLANSESKQRTKTDVKKPWVEKYRPKSVDEVSHQDEVVSVLKKCVNNGADLPNLLFYGPPGTGKTSTVLALCRELYGKDLYKDRVLELNASDERGIDVVRVRIKNFAQLSARSLREDGKKCPPYKIIILDEADSMTKASQEALRRTMEKQTKTTRFCLICNYVSRIIPPIASRCSQFRFQPLSIENQISRLQTICSAEGVDIIPEALKSLVSCTEGDLRKAVTYLQTAHSLKGKDGIDTECIMEITGVVPNSIIKQFIDSCLSNIFDKVQNAVNHILCEGHAATQIVSQVHDEIVFNPSFSDEQKCVIIEKIAVIDKCLIDGADEYLQLMALGTTIQLQACS